MDMDEQEDYDDLDRRLDESTDVAVSDDLSDISELSVTGSPGVCRNLCCDSRRCTCFDSNTDNLSEDDDDQRYYFHRDHPILASCRPKEPHLLRRIYFRELGGNKSFPCGKNFNFNNNYLSSQKIALRKILPTYALKLKHVFLGLSKCCQFLLSYTCSEEMDEISFNPIYKYRLHWWSFVPNQKSRKVSEVVLFGNSNVYNILYIALCQWPLDNSRVVVYGNCFETNQTQQRSYLTITTVPSLNKCEECLKVAASYEEEDLAASWDSCVRFSCLKHSATIHTTFDVVSPYPDFIPSVSMKLDGHVLLNTGNFLHVLSTNLENTGKTGTNINKQQNTTSVERETTEDLDQNTLNSNFISNETGILCKNCELNVPDFVLNSDIPQVTVNDIERNSGYTSSKFPSLTVNTNSECNSLIKQLKLPSPKAINGSSAFVDDKGEKCVLETVDDTKFCSPNKDAVKNVPVPKTKNVTSNTKATFNVKLCSTNSHVATTKRSNNNNSKLEVSVERQCCDLEIDSCACTTTDVITLEEYDRNICGTISANKRTIAPTVKQRLEMCEPGVPTSEDVKTDSEAVEEISKEVQIIEAGQELNITVTNSLSASRKKKGFTCLKFISSGTALRLGSPVSMIKLHSKVAAEAEKAYEFTDDVLESDSEKFSSYRRRRLADKKYEFCEECEDAENIVPFQLHRRRESTTRLESPSLFHPLSSHISGHRRCINDSHSESVDLISSPRSPTSSHFVGHRRRHLDVLAENIDTISGPKSPPAASNDFFLQTTVETDKVVLRPLNQNKTAQRETDALTVDVLKLPVNKKLEVSSPQKDVLSPSEDNSKVGEICNVPEPSSRPKCTVQMRRRYIEVDDELISVITDIEDDDLSDTTGYHCALPLEVHGAGYVQLQMISNSKADKLMAPGIVVLQRSFDIEQFCHETAEQLCKESDKKYWFCNDYDVEVVDVCPHSGDAIALAVMRMHATVKTKGLAKSKRTQGNSKDRKQYQGEVLFTWNFHSNKYTIVQKKELVEVCKDGDFQLFNPAKNLSEKLRRNLQELCIYPAVRFCNNGLVLKGVSLETMNDRENNLLLQL